MRGNFRGASVIALLVTVIAAGGLMLYLMGGPADVVAEDTTGTPIEAGESMDQIPVSDQTTVIHGVHYYVNENGMSYGGTEDALWAYDRDHEGPHSGREDWEARWDYYPDLIAFWVQDANRVGFMTKADYCKYADEWIEDALNRPVHQDGVEDYVYIPLYDVDGVTQVGTHKSLVVRCVETCILSDGAVYLQGPSGAHMDFNSLNEATDEYIEELAGYLGYNANDIAELKTERDSLL